MTLLAKDPTSFNDPFEVRPYFDQQCHDHFAKTHEQFYASALGLQNSLMGGRSMVGFPTENAIGFGEHLTKTFRDELGRRFRVVCLSRSATNILMWGHYTRSYRGYVIGIDTEHPDFPKGLKTEGFDINYSSDRSVTRLPLAFFQSPSVESYDILGKIVNHPDEQVQSDGGLLIPFRECRRRVEEAFVTALTTKAKDWEYEREIRFIYDLADHGQQLITKGNLKHVPIPSGALKEIIVGFRADVEQVPELVKVYRSGRIGCPKLFYTGCHPNKYEVEPHSADDKYLLGYFESVLPAHL
jgi:hypothetical protein